MQLYHGILNTQHELHTKLYPRIVNKIVREDRHTNLLKLAYWFAGNTPQRAIDLTLQPSTYLTGNTRYIAAIRMNIKTRCRTDDDSILLEARQYRGVSPQLHSMRLWLGRAVWNTHLEQYQELVTSINPHATPQEQIETLYETVKHYKS